VSIEPGKQRRFYETRVHEHLQLRDQDFYAEKLTTVVAESLGLGPGDRVLEVGAGFGRFTLALLRRCGSVVASDLAPRALATLERARDERGIPVERCTTRCLDVTTLDADGLGERFSFLVGFFLLHHLPDVARCVARLAPLLAPGGQMAFVEPNRRNPLFLAQVACCSDMTWAEEKGMFQLSHSSVTDAFRAAGLVPAPVQRFGFFPPQVLNRSHTARRIEARLEASPALRPLLPFLLLRARRSTAG
jgi:SAM-dependent methyltransferase